MARPLRIEYSGALYHVTARGNERRRIFKDDEDRKLFLNTLKKVNKRFNWVCHAYTLMDNHYHLVIETPDGNLSKGMRQLNGVYTQAFNKRHKRVGHIFQGRYKAVLIQKETHLLEVCRYIVLNAVRSGSVKSPAAWKWSSYPATAGTGTSHPCLTTDWVLGQFGTQMASARKRYKKFVRDGIGEESIWSKVKGQVLLGENDFADKFFPYLKRHEEIKEIPKSQRFVNRPSLERIFGESMRADKRVRNKMIRAAIVEYGYNQKEVADHLNMHYSSISRLLKNEEMLKSKT